MTYVPFPEMTTVTQTGQKTDNKGNTPWTISERLVRVFSILQLARIIALNH